MIQPPIIEIYGLNSKFANLPKNHLVDKKQKLDVCLKIKKKEKLTEILQINGFWLH